MTRFLCLSREDNALLYETDSLESAQGFVSGSPEPTRICCSLDSMGDKQFLYRVCIVDSDTGQVVSDGPILDISDCPEAMLTLQLVLMPCGEGVTL